MPSSFSANRCRSEPTTGAGYGHWWPDETSGGELAVAASSSGTPRLPGLDDVVEVAAGRYGLGEPGEEREVDIGAVLVGRYPVTNGQLGAFVEATGERLAVEVARRGHDPQLAPPPPAGGGRAGRGGSSLAQEGGRGGGRSPPADPARATPTTGFRIAIDPD